MDSIVLTTLVGLLFMLFNIRLPSKILVALCIVFHKAAVQNIYNLIYFKTLSMCISNAVKKQSSIGFIVDALFGNITYLHSLYTVVELYTNFVFFKEL